MLTVDVQCCTVVMQWVTESQLALEVCLSVCLPVCLSVCLFVCLPACLSAHEYLIANKLSK